MVEAGVPRADVLIHPAAVSATIDQASGLVLEDDVAWSVRVGKW